MNPTSSSKKSKKKKKSQNIRPFTSKPRYPIPRPKIRQKSLNHTKKMSVKLERNKTMKFTKEKKRLDSCCSKKVFNLK